MARTRAAIFGAALVLAGSLVSAVPAANAARPVAKPPPLLAVTVSANQPAGLAHESRVTSTWKSGAFSGFSAIAAKDFGVWRGRPITSATDFQTNASWSAFDAANRVVQIWKNQSSGILLSIAVPLWAGYGDHLAAAAGGYFNQHYTQMAKSLVAAGLGHSVLRLGWEFNGGWFRWGITAHNKPAEYAARARQFAKAWRQAVTAIRHVKGAHFTFDWCLSAGPHYDHPALAYPGDKYVDYVGMDVYDWNRDGHPGTFKARWDAIRHQGTGLDWLAKFANAHGKLISIPEWALVHDTFDKKHSGGDDKAFIDHMHTWFANHRVGYENYFNATDGWMSFSMNDSSKQFPLAGKLYKALWSRPGGLRRVP